GHGDSTGAGCLPHPNFMARAAARARRCADLFPLEKITSGLTCGARFSKTKTNSTMNLFRRKSVTDLQAEALTDHSLNRALGAVNLTALGIGAIIGTGIFVLTGTVAAQNAGPAVVLSFVLAGVASVFAALCYSEFAALVPMAGSAYTYGYATLGELFAWIIG